MSDLILPETWLARSLFEWMGGCPMAVLRQWGSSLAVRIPARISKKLKLYAGKLVDVAVRDGAIVVTPRRPKYRLRDLLKNCRPHQLHGETPFGPDVGREVVD